MPEIISFFPDRGHLPAYAQPAALRVLPASSSSGSGGGSSSPSDAGSLAAQLDEQRRENDEAKREISRLMVRFFLAFLYFDGLLRRFLVYLRLWRVFRNISKSGN